MTILFFASTAAPGGAVHQAADGVTALITFPGSMGDLALVPDEDGDYTARIAIFQEVDGDWEQVEMVAALRVFEDTGPLEVTDRVSILFTSSATQPVDITFPGDDFTGGPLDVFVTFSALGVDPGTGTVPTSHHHIVKNLLIDFGEYDLADGFDHHSTRVVAL